MNKKFIQKGICVLLSLLYIASGKAQQTDNHHFETSKQLDIFNALVKELDMFYVDTIDTQQAIKNGIDYMLSKLDPYTQYYTEEGLSEFKFITTGEYGGIGSVISQRGDKVVIADPYEGMPAALNGLQPGDEILEIDGESFVGKTTTLASEKLKGQPNTVVKIKYQRPGEFKPRTLDITRKIIQINPVTYYGVLPGTKVGYINLSSFTDHSAIEVKQAFLELKKDHQINSLVLDLRDNPGGLMEDAIQIVNLFVPKGEVVLSTKGKVKQWDRTYRTTQEPIDTEIPLAVLINNSSASSSEIVAGALQDLDRAIIVGNRTFGKGLVQVSRELPYNTGLKVTTYKYYIPSGRCIQAIDYSHKSPEGKASVMPDSLTSVFYTSKGREVKDGGGIAPDFTVEEKKIPTMLYYLDSEYIFFDFANQYKQKNPSISSPEEFTLTNQEYEAFKEFVKSKDFTYDLQSEKAFKLLRETMEFEGYLNDASGELTALEEKIKPNLDRDLDNYKEDILLYLNQEIVKRYYYTKGALRASLKNDPDVNKALAVLADNELYNTTLKN